MLSNYCRLWAEQLDDEQVLDICRQIKAVLAYVETGPDKNDENGGSLKSAGKDGQVVSV